MKKLTLILLLLFFRFVVQSEVAPTVKNTSGEFYKNNIEKAVISSLYRRGEYLIYDCINKHFACVIGPHYERCRETGTKEIVYDSNFCLKIKEFQDQPSCFVAHEQFSDKSRMKFFCKREMERE